MSGIERYREEAGKFEKTDLLLAVAVQWGQSFPASLWQAHSC